MKLLGSEAMIDASCGSKAYHLHILMKLGMSVPKGFLVTSMREIENEAVFLQAIDAIGGFPVAIRSSCTLEDLKAASFAGLYETFLNISDIEEARLKIRACFDSAKSERVTGYLGRKGYSVSASQLEASMKVLVQKMIDPRASGVAFGIDPLLGREETQLIECVAGLGERLVSGEITPTRYRYDIVANEVTEETTGDDGIRLHSQEVEAISEALSRIQTHFESLQDVEWCIDADRKLWILQARPITKISPRTDVEELTNADLKDGGISARVCTPLMFSLYEWVMNDSMSAYFKKLTLLESRENPRWLYYYYCRGYWNASLVKKCLYKIPGFDERKFDEDLGIQKDYAKHAAKKIPTNLKTVLRALPILYFLHKEYKDCASMVEDYKEIFPKLDEHWKTQIGRFEKMDDHEFYSQFERMIFDFFLRTEKNYFRTIYNNSNWQSDLKSHLEKANKKSTQAVSTLEMMSGLNEVSHLEIQNDLRELARALKEKGRGSSEAKNAFERFLDRHYHHGDAELDLTVPRWGEIPEKIWKMAEEFIFTAQQKQKPFDLQSIQNAKTRKLVERARYFLLNREKMREFSTRSYFIVRQFVLEFSRRLKKARLLENEDHIFFFTTQELLEVSRDRGNLRKFENRIPFRTMMYKTYKNFSAPNEFGGKVAQKEAPAFSAANQLMGVGSATGIYKGRVKVVRSLEESSKLESGDILVTRFTDPGWTPLLGKASAVVTEVGGILSHAAVISREYGIPAVLNIQGVTSILNDGDIVEVNGDTGLITLLSRSHG